MKILQDFHCPQKFLARNFLRMSFRVTRVILLPLALCFVFFLTHIAIAHAQTADDLQQKIVERNKDISKLEQEIKSYQKEIDTLGSQAVSLAATIKSLDLTRKKLEVNISITEDKITTKNLEIQKLGTQIKGKENNIKDDQRIIIQTFATLYTADDQSLPEIILSSHSVADAWDSLDQLGILQKSIYGKITSLQQIKVGLETTKNATEKAKAELIVPNKQLTEQRTIVLSTAAEKNSLLKQTDASEASYKKLLADKKAQEAAFQQEINVYESQLHLLVNPALIPHAGSGVLSWPLDAVFVTQYFGNTPFSTANPQIYNGKGHTGVDFRASIGTPIKAALSGVVVGISNTDLVRGCYSYGRWIMIKHANGLSTLYAHLSLETVSVGQVVRTGQNIGYSGNTGYSTGPHLHFGVYATQGVVIKKFDSSINRKGATIPIADFSAYLNPLSFL